MAVRGGEGIDLILYLILLINAMMRATWLSQNRRVWWFAKAPNIGQHSTSLAPALVELRAGRPGFVYATMEDNSEASDVVNTIHVFVFLLVIECSYPLVGQHGQLAKLAGLVAILA